MNRVWLVCFVPVNESFDRGFQHDFHFGHRELSLTKQFLTFLRSELK